MGSISIKNMKWKCGNEYGINISQKTRNGNLVILIKGTWTIEQYFIQIKGTWIFEFYFHFNERNRPPHNIPTSSPLLFKTDTTAFQEPRRRTPIWDSENSWGPECSPRTRHCEKTLAVIHLLVVKGEVAATMSRTILSIRHLHKMIPFATWAELELQRPAIWEMQRQPAICERPDNIIFGRATLGRDARGSSSGLNKAV